MALFQLGKVARPSLVEAIKIRKSESAESKNAARAFQLIFRENFPDGVKYIEKPAEESENDEGRKRLIKVSELTKAESKKQRYPVHKKLNNQKLIIRSNYGYT